MGPSLLIVECLHSLSSSLHGLGMVHHPTPFTRVAFGTISRFSDAFVQAVHEGVFLDHVQALYDLSFIRRVISTWQSDSVSLMLLDKAIVWIQVEFPCMNPLLSTEIDCSLLSLRSHPSTIQPRALQTHWRGLR